MLGFWCLEVGDGRDLRLLNWAPGQPSGVNQQNQINMWAGYSGKWTNHGAPAYPTRTYKWVCEWYPAVSCTYSLSSQGATVSRSGGSNLFFSVQASAPSCAWTAGAHPHPGSHWRDDGGHRYGTRDLLGRRQSRDDLAYGNDHGGGEGLHRHSAGPNLPHHQDFSRTGSLRRRSTFPIRSR